MDMKEICTDQNRSQKAMALYKNLFAKRFTIKECPYPCTFTKTFYRENNALYIGDVSMTFSKLIKTTKARYSYRELELLAELGGYVGLFLGISVLSLKDLLAKFLQLA